MMMEPKFCLPKDPQAKFAMQRWDELRSDRTQFEADWESIAQLIRPQRGGFGLDNPASRTPVKPLSSAPVVAQMNLSAGLHGTLTNPANRWFSFGVSDPELGDWQPMREWLDTCTTIVLNSFRPTVSPFYDAAIQLFSDISAFGNAAQYDEMIAEEQKIMDMTISLAQVVWSIDAWGRVNEIVRKFSLKPRAAVQRFGKERLPAKVYELAEKASSDDIWFYQHVLPNDEFMRGRLGYKGKRWLSVFVCEIEQSLVSKAGFDEMPFHAPRWEVDSGFSYGHGPGFVALGSARVAHRMDDAVLRAAQYAADPVRLAPDRDTWPLHGTVRPGRTVYGGLDMRGNQMLRNLEATPHIGLTAEERARVNEEIRDAFSYQLMQLAGRTGMTATEVITIQEERQRLMAPNIGRVQHEYLAPKVQRRFSMLWRAGQIPKPPQEAEGIALDVEYTSAAAMAQRSAEGVATVRLFQDLGPLAQYSQDALERLGDRLDVDGAIDAIHAAHGAPATVLRSKDEADARAKARAEAQAMMAQLQAAQQAASAAKDAGAAAGSFAQAGMPMSGEGM